MEKGGIVGITSRDSRAIDSDVVEAHKNVKLAWRLPNYCNVAS